MMTNDATQNDTNATDEQKPLDEQSPSEKLRDEEPQAPAPGAQRPEDTTVKHEVNLNTE